MTTNKPKVVAYLSPAGEATMNNVDHVITEAEFARKMNAGGIIQDTVQGAYSVPLVSLSDYEALQAECDALRAKTGLSLGVGDGTGNLFVHGDYDSIKRVQALIFGRNYGKTSPCGETNPEKPKYLHGQRVIVDNDTIATFSHYENADLAIEALWVELPDGVVQWRSPHNVKPLPGGQL